MRTTRGAPREVMMAVSSSGNAIVNGPMLRPASQEKPTNSAVETIPAIQEIFRSVTRIAMRPSTSALAKASQRIAATNEGSTPAIIDPGTNTRERGETTYSGGDEPRRRASDRHQRTGGIPSPGRL